MAVTEHPPNSRPGGPEAAPAGELPDALLRPEAYPFPVERVELLQTHVSWLFFAGERVYKVKKPVDLGFLDFRGGEERAASCRDEVLLNRELAPGVHLGVVPIVRDTEGTLTVGGPGQPVEWAVEMVRLPSHRMLDAMLARGEIDNGHVNALASRLARFHRDAPTGEGVDRHGRPGAVAANVLENFDALRPLVDARDPAAIGASCLSGRQLAFLEGRARAFLAEHRPLFEERVRTGRIRDGHGDLHAGNICFAEELLIYDRIEFAPRFRCGDVAADVAFLAMDLDHRGFPAFSRYFVRRYAEESGDPRLPELIDFYKGYRALVRAKVATLAAADAGGAPEERADQRRSAARYLLLASGYELSPVLVLTCGLPASGKTWLARALAAPLRATVLRSDVRRKVEAGLAPSARAAAPHGAGLYTPERRAATYRSLLASALRLLRRGQSAIVDATFARVEERRRFVDAAARLGLPYFVLHARAPEGVIRERLAARAGDPGEASDAGLEVYLRERDAFEPPLEVPAGHLVVVDTATLSPEAAGARLAERWIAASEPGAGTAGA